MRLILGACVALTLAAPAAAEMPQIQSGRYRCATAFGQVLTHDIRPLQPGQELRVAFRLLKDNGEGNRHATAAVVLESANGRSTVAVGRAVNDPFQMFAAVETPGVPVQQVMYEFPITDKWIILKLTLDSHGYLTVRANDLTQRYKMGASEVTSAALHCHSGEWEIDVWPRSYVTPAAGEPSPPNP